jgi:membrane-associated phospholipid phosphatase
MSPASSAPPIVAPEPSHEDVFKTRGVQRLIFASAALVLAFLLDSWVYQNFRMADIYSHDWGRMLRVLGFLPLWMIAAIALWLHERPAAARRPLSLFLSPAFGGLAAEVLKLILRRERPGAHNGEYYFRPFTERTFSTSGLALPSSHALVAFGAAAILSQLFPRAWIVWWALAWGCGLSRMAAGAHFFSDVMVAAVAGWIVGRLVAKWLLK